MLHGEMTKLFLRAPMHRQNAIELHSTMSRRSDRETHKFAHYSHTELRFFCLTSIIYNPFQREPRSHLHFYKAGPVIMRGTASARNSSYYACTGKSVNRVDRA